MYMHSGTTDFLKWCLWIGATFVAVSWVAGIIGGEATLIVIGAIVLVIVFAGGALFAHANQKMTLDAMNKSSAQDAQIDRYRMQSLTEYQKGQTAWNKANAQISVVEAKTVNRLADQRAKLLVSDHRQQQEQAAQVQQDEFWTIDADSDFQEW